MNFDNLFQAIPSNPLLAVSGGADSMALLRMFQNTHQDYGIAHVSYGTDEWRVNAFRLVQQFAISFQKPLHHHFVRILSKKGSGFEAKAREARYQFFAKVIQLHRYSSLITAHTLDDLAETVEIAIRRKQGEHAKAGIPKIGELKIEENSVPIFRPFLEITREQLRNYLKENQIPWIEDPTNFDPSFSLRNQIRHEWSKLDPQEYQNKLIEMKMLAEEANQLILNARNYIQNFIKDKLSLEKENQIVLETKWLKNLTDIELIEFLHYIFSLWNLQLGAVSGGQRNEFLKILSENRWGAEGSLGNHLKYRITSKYTVFHRIRLRKMV